VRRFASTINWIKSNRSSQLLVTGPTDSSKTTTDPSFSEGMEKAAAEPKIAVEVYDVGRPHE
jgi:hypothetical protein